MNKIPRSVIAIFVVLFTILADQVLKIWVKTNMALYESIHITDWFQIQFAENNGMAFGIEVIDKLFLTLFRIVAVCFIVYYLHKIVKQKYNYGYVVCIALILAGAFGNIVDCVFYGEIFSESTRIQVAEFVPVGEGYGTWLHGRVVDMFYFPLFKGSFPSWIPFWGGQDFTFFNAIFNIADAAISVGIVVLLLFYRKTLSYSLQEEKNEEKI
ncbi:lipoprotein signal peptidase [Dysgonomonas sp. 520]|uniref:lipoprotein signal peptidase n=1 Tax=Dysgonomonas sp. 520 TaxID=2302931 RepID=UPI0013D734BB|nr:lipoprotein signal peptidase [Dysgonomonas sp. 520]NDW09036.1 lipoprotein signal peptidase [Dysgonomonas sp. 520]